MAKQITYVEIDGPAPGDFGPQFPRESMHLVGDPVEVAFGLNTGKIGRITGYGRPQKLHEEFLKSGDEEILIAEEGPIVSFEDGSTDWFPGMAEGMIRMITDVPIYRPDPAARGRLSDQDKLAIPLTIETWQMLKELLNDDPRCNARRETNEEKGVYDTFALIDDELERHGWLS